MALAMLSVSAVAGFEDGLTGNGGVDVLGDGIFETTGTLSKYPPGQDTNIDTLEVGNDRALAFGNIWLKVPQGTATNDLEIKKNQDSGNCPDECCKEKIESTEYDKDGNPNTLSTTDCTDCCIKVNIDQIKVGNREAMAFGIGHASNKVKIVANQQ